MEVDVSLKIARNGAPVLQGLGARALRAVAIAVLTVGLQMPVVATAAGAPSDDATTFAIHPPIAAIAPPSGTGSADIVPLQNDDGEDHFDEGDDEFDCDNVNEGEDPCVDDPEDRLDAGDDEYDGGCADLDDGNDRCLDDIEPQLDQPVATHATTVTTDPAPAAATTPAAPDAALGVAALASAFALGAGSLWFLRRVHR